MAAPPCLGISARLRIGTCITVAILHAIVIVALITRHAAAPLLVPKTVALRLIGAPSPRPTQEVALPIPALSAPAWTPVIAPPNVQSAPALAHRGLLSLNAPSAVAQFQAAQPGTAPSKALPVTAPPPARSPGAESRSWQDRLTAWLQAHRTYPDAARRAGEEGSPTIRFTIARDGTVTAVSLVRTSGSGRLDAAALALLDHAQVPALPAIFPDSVSVTISVRYSLTR